MTCKRDTATVGKVFAKAPSTPTTVSVTRGGACIEVTDVPLSKAGAMLDKLMGIFDALTEKHDKLVDVLPDVGTGPATEFNGDGVFEWAKKKRVGF